MNQEGKSCTDRVWQAACEQVDSRMDSAMVSAAGSKKCQPDQQVTRQLLGPEKRVVQNIAVDHLEYDHGGHGNAQGAETPFDPGVAEGAEAVEQFHRQG